MNDTLNNNVVKSAPAGSINNVGNKVQTALLLLGIDPSLIYGTRHQTKGINYNPNSSVSGGFWNRSNEYYWNMLELAKQNYDTLIRKYHPDIFGPKGNEISVQLNTAWNLIKKAFSKKGYELGE